LLTVQPNFIDLEVLNLGDGGDTCGTAFVVGVFNQGAEPVYMGGQLVNLLLELTRCGPRLGRRS